MNPAVERDGFHHICGLRMRRKDGSVFPAQQSVLPLHSERGSRNFSFIHSHNIVHLFYIYCKAFWSVVNRKKEEVSIECICPKIGRF